jgi:hypothetical protein
LERRLAGMAVGFLDGGLDGWIIYKKIKTNLLFQYFNFQLQKKTFFLVGLLKVTENGYFIFKKFNFFLVPYKINSLI